MKATMARVTVAVRATRRSSLSGGWVAGFRACIDLSVDLGVICDETYCGGSYSIVTVAARGKAIFLAGSETWPGGRADCTREGTRLILGVLKGISPHVSRTVQQPEPVAPVRQVYCAIQSGFLPVLKARFPPICLMNLTRGLVADSNAARRASGPLPPLRTDADVAASSVAVIS